MSSLMYFDVPNKLFVLYDIVKKCLYNFYSEKTNNF